MQICKCNKSLIFKIQLKVFFSVSVANLVAQTQFPQFDFSFLSFKFHFLNGRPITFSNYESANGREKQMVSGLNVDFNFKLFQWY